MAEMAGSTAVLVINGNPPEPGYSGYLRMWADGSQIGIPLILIPKIAGGSLKAALKENPALRVGIRTHAWVAEGAHEPESVASDVLSASTRPLSPAGVDDPTCWCTTDGTSGGAKVPYSRCGDHFNEGNIPWCFVTGGTQCKAATPSLLSPGAAWRECVSSQCACTSDGMSGSTNVTPKVGCQDRSAQGIAGFCYVAGGEKCATLLAGESLEDARASHAFPKPPVGKPGAAYRICAPEACQCTKTGLSGGVPVEMIGCADHFNEETLPWYADPFLVASAEPRLR